MVLQNELSQTLDKMSDILLFKSYIQVRALKHGASTDKALLFDNILQLRAFEAGATIAKALKTTSLKYVQILEKRKILGDDNQPQKQIALIEDKHHPSDIVENLNIDANYIFIVQKSHLEKYNLSQTLNLIAPNCKIVCVDGLTEGAACTTLLAKDFIDNDSPLLMANSDQFVEWFSDEFMYNMNTSSVDGGILTFNSTHPKWSYAKLDNNGFVSEVAEKNPISNIATVGIYYWKKGSDYVKYAEQMIEKNVRTNNEFYVCPVFNEAILDNKKIKTFNIEKMWGLGTPEDLKYFLENK
jgi:hypothetical protein